MWLHSCFHASQKGLWLSCVLIRNVPLSVGEKMNFRWISISINKEGWSCAQVWNEYTACRARTCRWKIFIIKYFWTLHMSVRTTTPLLCVVLGPLLFISAVSCVELKWTTEWLLDWNRISNYYKIKNQSFFGSGSSVVSIFLFSRHNFVKVVRQNKTF